jgi:hypothetical protein
MARRRKAQTGDFNDIKRCKSNHCFTNHIRATGHFPAVGCASI